MHVLTAADFEGERNLVSVRDLVFRGSIRTRQRLESERADCTPYDLLWAEMTNSPSFDGQVSGIGEEFSRVSRNAPEQWAGVHDAALSATNFINNGLMRASLASSDFQLSDLKTDPAGVTVYLTIPSRDKEEDFRWLRVMVSLVTTEMERLGPSETGRHPVLVFLDEFATLQKMERIESGIAELAKYGVKLIVIVQNLGQLKTVYNDSWETFLSNCGTKVFFGIDDPFTSEHVSSLIGETELVRVAAARTEGISLGQSVTHSLGESRTDQQSAGKSRSESFKRGVLNLRDTAGFFRRLSGNATATDSSERSSSQSRSIEASRAEAVSVGRERSNTLTEHIHQRRLVTPDEVRRFFARVTDDSNPLYPGVEVVLVSDGSNPALVRRTNYFDDARFVGTFVPPSHHRQQAPFVEVNVGIAGLEKVKLLSGWILPGHGLALPDARWLVSDGQAIKRGEPILEIASGVGGPQTIQLRSPISGVRLMAHAIGDQPNQAKWLAVLLCKETQADIDIVAENNKLLLESCGQALRVAHGIRWRHMAAAGAKSVCALLFLAGVVAAGTWMAALASFGLFVALGVWTARSLRAWSLMGGVIAQSLADRDGRFVADGPYRHDPT
jgi:hypothetical protein